MKDDGTSHTRVAVIGSGLAGLTAAHLLSVIPSDVQVYVFEKSEELGMDNSSISIKGEKGASYRIDVPMRSINTGSHGRVKKLYDYLKVPMVKNEFSYSFSNLPSPSSASDSSPNITTLTTSAVSSGVTTRIGTPLPPYSAKRTTSPPPPPFTPHPSHATTTLIYEGASGLRWPPVSIPSNLACSTRSLPSLIRSTWQQSNYIVHLIFLAISYLHVLILSFFYVKLGLTQSRKSFKLPLIRGRIENVSQESLSDFCQRHGVSSSMKHEILIPLMAAVCTVGIEESRQMPVGEVLEYITSTFLSSHYTTLPSFGVRGIVRRLIAPVKVENIVLNSNIYQIRFNDETSELRAYTLKYKVDHDNGEEEEQGEELDVDYIIFATQANQAATLLQTINNDTTSLNKTISALNSFKYVQALVVNHTDQSFLPLNPLDRRDLNLVAFDGSKKNKQDELSEGIWITHLPSTSVETTHLVSAHPSLSDSLSTTNSTKRSTSSSSIVLQTTNPLRPIDPTKILSSSWFSRAFVTKESKKVLPKFFLGERRERRKEGEVEVENLQGLLLGSEEKEENGRRRSGGIYFTGSWCERGIPLLEGCVTSAEGVVRELLEREEGGTRRTKKDWPF